MHDLEKYRSEAKDALASILQFWMHYTIDEVNGGFFGKVGNNNKADTNAPKGSVLNGRILWTFAAAYNLSKDKQFLIIAERAFNYIKEYFIDEGYGGVYWTVDYAGKPLDTKKQVYAIAFCMYGLSEFYKASGNNKALELALQLYEVLETYSHDKNNKGYFEAFTREWQETKDLRLSAKDANEKKTMNTHLHVVEAYANLYGIYKNEQLRNNIIELLELFDAHFIDHKTFHLKLFFDEAWNEKPDVISYGHDIEAAWLLLQCAEAINHAEWIEIYKQHAVKITNAAAEGLDNDGGLWYEYEPVYKKIIKEKHWWPQAEAMVGFYNAYQIAGDEKYLIHSFGSWQFIKKYLLDHQHGEWFWGVKEDHSIMQNEDKAGLWKCPYHNARACLEIIKRIG